jgi:hypothetical protein
MAIRVEDGKGQRRQRGRGAALAEGHTGNTQRGWLMRMQEKEEVAIKLVRMRLARFRGDGVEETI